MRMQAFTADTGHTDFGLKLIKCYDTKAFIYSSCKHKYWEINMLKYCFSIKLEFYVTKASLEDSAPDRQPLDLGRPDTDLAEINDQLSITCVLLLNWNSLKKSSWFHEKLNKRNGWFIPLCQQGMAHQFGSWCIPSGFFLWLPHLCRLQIRCHHKRTHQWPECSRQGCRPSLTRRAPCSRGLPQRWPPPGGLLEGIGEIGRKYKLPVIIIIKTVSEQVSDGVVSLTKTYLSMMMASVTAMLMPDNLTPLPTLHTVWGAANQSRVTSPWLGPSFIPYHQPIQHYLLQHHAYTGPVWYAEETAVHLTNKTLETLMPDYKVTRLVAFLVTFIHQCWIIKTKVAHPVNLMLSKLRILAVNEVQHVVRLIHAVSSLYRAGIKYWNSEPINQTKAGLDYFIFSLFCDKTRTPMFVLLELSTVIWTCEESDQSVSRCTGPGLHLAKSIWCRLMQVLVWLATQSKLGTTSPSDSLLAAMTWAQQPGRHFPGHNVSQPPTFGRYITGEAVAKSDRRWHCPHTFLSPLCLCVMVRQG